MAAILQFSKLYFLRLVITFFITGTHNSQGASCLLFLCFLCKCRKKAPKEPSITYPRRSYKKGYILIEVSTHMEYLFPGFFSFSNNVNVTLFIFCCSAHAQVIFKKTYWFPRCNRRECYVAELRFECLITVCKKAFKLNMS